MLSMAVQTFREQRLSVLNILKSGDFSFIDNYISEFDLMINSFNQLIVYN